MNCTHRRGNRQPGSVWRRAACGATRARRSPGRNLVALLQAGGNVARGSYFSLKEGLI